MTTIQLVQESVRSAPTEIWRNYDNKDFKDQRIQDIYAKVANFWKNFFSFGLWGYFKKREIKLLIKEAVCTQKTSTLPQLQQRIKDLVSQNLKPAAAQLQKEFFYFKTSELSLLLQDPHHEFDPATHWVGVKHFLRTKLYRNEKALGALDALIRVPKKEFSQAAAHLKGEAKSANADALRLIARGYVETRNHPQLLATLPRRVQELFNDPKAQTGFQTYFVTLKWPELPALQQTVGFLRTSGATTAVQQETLEASDHRFTYTKPELATALLADPAPAPAHRDWAVFRNQMREGVYRDNHVFELLAPLFSLTEADLKQISLHFKGKPSSLPQEKLDAIVKASAALKIYPELFLTLPLNIQKVLRKIPEETLAAAFLSLLRPIYERSLPSNLQNFGAEITEDAIRLAASDHPPAHHPALLRDAPRSAGKDLGWVPENRPDVKRPGIEIPFADPVTFHDTLDRISSRNHLDQASRLMLERLLSHDAYGAMPATLNLALNQLANPTFFAIGYTNSEPMTISIVEEEGQNLTIHYTTDLPLTDIFHSSVHEKGDGSCYKGDLRLAFTYRLVYDVEHQRHHVEGPFLEAPQFSFQPCPPPEKLIPATPVNPFEPTFDDIFSTSPVPVEDDPFATPPRSKGATPVPTTSEEDDPFATPPRSKAATPVPLAEEEDPFELPEEQPARPESRGSSIFMDEETASLPPELAAAAAELFDVPLHD